jgi:hypothetical protein
MDMSAKPKDIQSLSAVAHPLRAKLNCYLLYLLAAVCFLPGAASALVMRDNGPEPIIIQIKESLRLWTISITG